MFKILTLMLFYCDLSDCFQRYTKNFEAFRQINKHIIEKSNIYIFIDDKDFLKLPESLNIRVLSNPESLIPNKWNNNKNLNLTKNLSNEMPSYVDVKPIILTVGREIKRSAPHIRENKMNSISTNLRELHTIAFFLRNFSVISSFMDKIMENPTTTKIIFLYDECFKISEKKSQNEDLLKFFQKLWYNHRISFIFVIPFCISDATTKDQFSLQERMNSHFKKTDLIPKLEVEINRENEEKLVIQLVYCYDPFALNPGGDKEKPVFNQTKFGRLLQVDLFKINLGILQKCMRNFFNLKQFHLKVAFFANSMAIYKTDVPFLSKNLPQDVVADPDSKPDAYFGLEIDVLMELSKRMNFVPVISPPADNMYYGFKQENGTFNGALGDILYSRADFGMNGFFIKDYETREVEFTTSTQDDKLCIVVQTPALIPDALLLFEVFSPSVWLLLFGTFVIISVVYCWFLHYIYLLHMQKFSMDSNQYKFFKSSNENYNKLSTLLSQCARIIAVLLNAPLSYPFNSSYEKVFAVLCLLWGLNVMGSFQGSLVDVYTISRSYPSIDTLEGLDKSGISIYVRHQGLIVDLFGTEQKGTPLGNLRQKLVPTEDDDLNSRIVRDGNIAGLIRLSDVTRSAVAMPYRQDGATMLHAIMDCPKSYNVAFLFRKSSILLRPANYYLGLFASNGLISKWIKDTIYVFKFESDLRNRELANSVNVILNISHLQLAFFMLLLGVLASFLIFCMEILWDRKLNSGTVKRNLKKNHI